MRPEKIMPSSMRDASPRTFKEDRRALRTKRLLLNALCEEIFDKGMDAITVSALTDRANLTRRTFYSHYKDAPDFIAHIEAELLQEFGVILGETPKITLKEMARIVSEGKPYPGAVILFDYLERNKILFGALIGPSGDASFQDEIKKLIRINFDNRYLAGIDTKVRKSYLDYYLEYIISLHLALIQRWLETGAHETPYEMACILSSMLFMRISDLCGEGDDEQ